MENYTIRCTPEQTKKAIKLGIPIITKRIINNYEVDIPNKPIIPTAEQMIGFLRNKGIKFHFNDITKYWSVTNKSEFVKYGWSEQKELDAIDAVLEYLTNNQTTE